MDSIRLSSNSTLQPQPGFHLFSLFIVTYACRNLTFPNCKNCECIKSPAVFDLIKLSFHSSFVILIQSIAPQSGRAVDWTQPWTVMYQSWLHTWCECFLNVCPSATQHYTTVTSSLQIWWVLNISLTALLLFVPLFICVCVFKTLMVAIFHWLFLRGLHCYSQVTVSEWLIWVNEWSTDKDKVL